MKSLFLFGVLIVLINGINCGKLNDEQHLSRSKRGVIGCAAKMPDVLKQCSKTLDDELDLDDKISQELKEDTPGQFKCCYFAKFTYCLKSELKDECGDTFSTMASKSFSGAAKLLAPKCDGYDYPSATCIFFVWFYYIIAAIVIFFLLSLGCCIARCICGRK